MQTAAQVENQLTSRQIAERKAKAKRAATLKAARARCEDFVEFAFRHEGTGKRVKNTWFHKEWQQRAREHKKLVVFAPVEHAKTQHLGIAKPLHLLGQDPARRIAVISNTEDQAKKNLRSIRQHIESNPLVRAVFPHLKPSSHPGDPWSSEAITVERPTISKDPSIQVCGSYGNIVGSRLDVIVLDDILDFDNTRTPEQRKKLIEWFETAVFTRLNDNGIILVIGTPWHQEDLMHVLASRPGFHVERYSGVENPDDPPRLWRPIWPAQWSLERLLDRYENTSEAAFLRKYLCRVRVDSAGRFRAAWINRMVALGKGRTFVKRPPKTPGGSELQCFCGVDLGVGENDTNAETCLFTIAVDNRGRRIVVDIEAGRWTAPEIIDRLRRNYMAYDSIIAVEDNAAQKFLVQIANEDFPVIGLTTGKNKHHEEFGVEALAVEIRNGWWVLPSGATGSIRGVHEEGRAWVSEMLHYDPTEHTGDRLMASWKAKEAARLHGMPKTGNVDMQAR